MSDQLLQLLNTNNDILDRLKHESLMLGFCGACKRRIVYKTYAEIERWFKFLACSAFKHDIYFVKFMKEVDTR